MHACMILHGTVGDYNDAFRLGEHNGVLVIRLMGASLKLQNVISKQDIPCLSQIDRTLQEPREILTEKKDIQRLLTGCSEISCESINTCKERRTSMGDWRSLILDNN